MLRIALFVALFVSYYPLCMGQVITLDGSFNDWNQVPIVGDVSTDGGSLDLLECAITHDDDFLFIRVKTAQEYGMINPGYTNSQLHIVIDTDFDIRTGRQDFNLGTELSILCGDKEILFDYPTAGAYKGSLYDVGFLSLPTVTAKEFEIAIRRDATPDGSNDLFLADSIRLFLYTTEGDYLPSRGNTIKHVFTDVNAPAYPSISVEKASSKSLRIMGYNVERGGLIDSRRQASIKRILTAAAPDVIGFSETQGSAAQIKDLLDDWLPNAGGWYTDKQGSNVLASRFPIGFSEPVWQGSTRSMGSVLNLPNDKYSTDLLVITSHPNCCSADEARQSQVDMIASFILDAKNQGGVLDVGRNTPIVMVGDFNLVGWQAQLNTLLNGTIDNESTYGKGAALDWDDSAMESASCLHTELPVAYTWRSASSSFSPGKLDYIFYSGSVMTELNSFTLDTETMSQSKLMALGLQAGDALNASDHLPLVGDFLLGTKPTSREIPEGNSLQIYPNPATTVLHINNSEASPFRMYSLQGQVVLEGFLQNGWSQLDVSFLPKGMYCLVSSNGSSTARVVID